jgi:hypothetical protein
MEEDMWKYFGQVVSEWNPCCSDTGHVRYLWDSELEAHDIEAEMQCEECSQQPEAQASGGLDAQAMPEQKRTQTFNVLSPERVRLSELLDSVLSADDDVPLDLEPVRKLVAALVQTSARHDLHGKGPPVLGKHACARGKPSCPYCRYGFPHSLVPRDGERPMHLEKGDREGQWFARFPCNDSVCCSYEPHILLANLGNIDWRPCLNVWAVVEYITKYAMKAPEGSRRMRDVLNDVMEEVCKYTEEGSGVDLLRMSLRKFYSRTLGERDYSIFEATLLGMRLPLVFPLMATDSLNTLGAKKFKTAAELEEELRRDPKADPEVMHDSKIGKFDDRKRLLRAQYAGDKKLQMERLSQFERNALHVSV